MAVLELLTGKGNTAMCLQPLFTQRVKTPSAEENPYEHKSSRCLDHPG